MPERQLHAQCPVGEDVREGDRLAEEVRCGEALHVLDPERVRHGRALVPGRALGLLPDAREVKDAELDLHQADRPRCALRELPEPFPGGAEAVEGQGRARRREHEVEGEHLHQEVPRVEDEWASALERENREEDHQSSHPGEEAERERHRRHQQGAEDDDHRGVPLPDAQEPPPPGPRSGWLGSMPSDEKNPLRSGASVIAQARASRPDPDPHEGEGGGRLGREEEAVPRGERPLHRWCTDRKVEQRGLDVLLLVGGPLPRWRYGVVALDQRHADGAAPVRSRSRTA